MKAVDDSDRRVAHLLQRAVVGEVAGSDDPDACLLEPALFIALDERDRLAARRQKHEYRFRLAVLDSLQKRREVRIGERRSNAVDDLSSCGLEGLDECRLRIDAGAKIGNQRENALDAVL